MKKYIAIGISLVIALSLTACGHPTQEQQEPGELQEVQQVGPVETETTSQTIDVQQTGGTPGEATPLGEEAQNIEEEAGTVDEARTVDGAGAVDEAGTTDEDIQSSEIQLFTDVNETVYATGTVNLRSGPGTSHDKVGSLTTGQSVTRTGKGITGTEAEGWSRVVLSNGLEVYVSSNYISTTKPVQQQSTPSSSSTSSSTSTPSTPSSSQGTTSSNNGGVTSPSGSASSSSSTTSSDDDWAAARDAAQAAMRQQDGRTYTDGGFTDEQIADIGSKLIVGD